MPDSFDYAVIRVVPRVERDEFINAGVILHCRSRAFLAAVVALDQVRLKALYPGVPLDTEAIETALALIPRIAAGDTSAGPIAKLPQAERFHWLVAPRSTIVQTSPVHSGLSGDPAGTLDHLVERMVKTAP
jgi:hypothetical protein